MTPTVSSVFDGKSRTGGHTDAFRHALWNARLTQRFGPEWAAEFATVHERGPKSHATPVAMDMHNHEVGRRIAVRNPNASPDEMARLVEQAVRNGEMVIIGKDDRLERGNQIEPGQTGATGPGNEWPTTNPDRDGHVRPGPPGAVPDTDC
ncbi:hypothetical protein JOF53_006638 [Crossiella equi]|uniref:DUF6973 domain-containing protein n=1 Tax=Crossiella equi TaxID=130796 RepID=A0ABS5AMI0_9PSEU|nr:hypothetical protein [Crossiella equi]MBP2477766.1 hypothetical protein [Crossiella equi]